ncbi:MAG: hypothetical protein ACPG49_10425 [Chitinophagales bacterium]
MRFLLCLLFVPLFFACSSDDSSTSKPKKEKPAELSEETKQNETTAIPKDTIDIEPLLDKIWDLQKIQKRAEYVKEQTNGERALKLRILEEPNEISSFYWIKVGEDNGMNFVSHFQFAINPSTKEVFYFDELSGEKVPVEEWEKME